jgi:hypothetical protein
MGLIARFTPRQSWQVTVAGEPHRIDLGPGTNAFSVDGVKHSLGGTFHRGPRTAAFQLGDQEASMTLRLLAPAVRPTFKRLFRDAIRNPLVLATYFLGGEGGGVAAGLAKVQWAWAIYELRVDGKSHGSWISSVVGESESWTFVEPGGALPEPGWLNWPSPRER